MLMEKKKKREQKELNKQVSKKAGAPSRLTQAPAPPRKSLRLLASSSEAQENQINSKMRPEHRLGK